MKTDIRGKTSTLQQLYIRGNQIVFCIVPDMLRNAPMFARIKQWRKYKGHPPVLASEGAKGQRAAIMRKGEGRRWEEEEEGGGYSIYTTALNTSALSPINLRVDAHLCKLRDRSAARFTCMAVVVWP